MFVWEAQGSFLRKGLGPFKQKDEGWGPYENESFQRPLEQLKLKKEKRQTNKAMALEPFAALLIAERREFLVRLSAQFDINCLPKHPASFPHRYFDV